MEDNELGKIERPEPGEVLGKRKAYVVALVYPIPGAPEGYEDRLNAYWAAVDDHVSRLEARAGTVKRILHEGISKGGEEGLKIVEQINEPAAGLVRSRVSAGATFEAIEDEDIFTRVIDWTRCLQVGLTNPGVVNTVRDELTKASEERQNHIEKRLSEAIGEAEAALLLVGSSRGLKLPDGTESFHVVPPELDALERWVQEANEAIRKTMEEAREAASAGEENKGESGGGSGPRLWTPG
jgi:hypothetical protein